MDNDAPAAEAAPRLSDDELAQCVAMLERFHGEEGLAHFQMPRYKRLRKAMLPLMDDLRQKFFHGNSVSDDTRRQDRKRQRKIEQARQRALDQKHIENTKLRADRLARLAELTAANPLLAQVPDGVAAPTDLRITAGGEPNSAAAADADATPIVAELNLHRACYTCKLKFKQLHHFYDRLCPTCAALNFKKRHQTADLHDYIAIVTGARVKIGYEIGLKLLRCGATLIATSRFPKDTALRYAKEADFAEWQHRLHVFGLDFRDLGVIDKFMDYVASTFGHVDILINNATQTVRRPTHYYKHLLEAEGAPLPEECAAASQVLQGNHRLLQNQAQAAPASSTDSKAIVRAEPARAQLQVSSAGVSDSVLLSQAVLLDEDKEDKGSTTLFPTGQVDNNKQQVDLRKQNTWVQKIDQVDTMELVEVFSINALAPFLLNKRVIPLLEKSSHPRKFIVNVSAMEGKFYRAKTPNHPHTNMAKAAANMMTRTCAEDLAKQCIYMNSVDTGWINDENPRDIAARIATDHNFQTPLDEIDAAARVLDPILALFQPDNTDPPLCGQFLKDYAVSEW